MEKVKRDGSVQMMIYNHSNIFQDINLFYGWDLCLNLHFISPLPSSEISCLFTSPII